MTWNDLVIEDGCVVDLRDPELPGTLEESVTEYLTREARGVRSKAVVDRLRTAAQLTPSNFPRASPPQRVFKTRPAIAPRLPPMLRRVGAA